MEETLEMQRLLDEDGDADEDEGKEEDFRTPKFAATHIHLKCPYLGVALAAISGLFFSLSSVIVKWMVDIHPIQLAAWRFVGVLLPAIPIVIYRSESPFPKGKRTMLILRAFLGCIGLMLSFYAFRHMPLADASVIVFSVPVFVSIFARIFLKEPFHLFNIVTTTITLIGLVVITRPMYIFGSSLPSNDRYDKVWGSVAAFSATLFRANVYVVLRALKGSHFSVILTNGGAFSSVFAISTAYYLKVLCLPPCGIDRYLIVALMLLSFGGQFLMTLALQVEEAGPVSIARSADIVFAFIWNVLFFSEVPDRYSIAGAIVVTFCVVLTGVRKWVLASPENYGFKKKLAFLARW